MVGEVHGTEPEAAPGNPSGSPPAGHRMLEAGLDTLSTELLDNRACQGLLDQLNDFENAVFGPDFGCPCSQIQPWIDSGNLLYAAVCGEAVAGRRRILSVLSVFITTTAERDAMLEGRAADYEMAPWRPGQPAEPSIYLSSVISAAPHHLLAMYDSLLRDARAHRDAHGLVCRTAFGIAAGAAGNRHLARSGFQLVPGRKYRGTYDLMSMEAADAATPFWRGLLTDAPIGPERAGGELKRGHQPPSRGRRHRDY